MRKRSSNTKGELLVRGIFYPLLIVVLMAATAFPLHAPLTLQAYAEEEPGSEEPGDGEEPPPYTAPKIADVTIRLPGAVDFLAFAINPSVINQVTISEKGGSIQFYSDVWWDDWSNDTNWYDVVWSLDDYSIASISPNGLVTARTDGTVKVSAKVDGINTTDGVDLVASVWVRIAGQTDARYVTSISITDEDNSPYPMGSAFIWEPDLAKDTHQFLAIVEVYDPVDGTTQTYITDGRLSLLATDLSDLRWFVEDMTYGAVEESTGLFRPLKYLWGLGLYVTSNAGFDNSPVTAMIWVVSEDPDGIGVDGYFPQESLTVKAYYELYPPSEYGNEAYVIDKTYSIAEVEGMGLFEQTYTAIGGVRGYYTMTGRGVPFATLLAESGIELAGVQRFEFSTADATVYSYSVSKYFIFDMDRYYFPNINDNLFNEAVRVFPMIALESNQRAGGSTKPSYDMSEATRFRLLFGATPGVQNTQYTVKWINTIYVVLSGGPSIRDDTGGDGGGGDGGSGPGPGTGEKGVGADRGTTGNTQEGVMGVNTESSGGDSQAAEGLAGGDEGKNQGNLSDEGGLSPKSNDEGISEGYTVYQIMNKNNKDLQLNLDYQNPLRQVSAPLGAFVFIAGGAEAFFWYRRQIRMSAFVYG